MINLGFVLRFFVNWAPCLVFVGFCHLKCCNLVCVRFDMISAPPVAASHAVVLILVFRQFSKL